jgi:hypothetical protein
LVADRLRGLLLVSVLLACLAGACSTRPGHASPTGGPAATGATKQHAPDAGVTKGPKPDAGGPELPAAAEDDCVAICAKLIRCKHGPWDTNADCVDACEGAREDETASKTYRCAAKATTCAKLKRCGR